MFRRIYESLIGQFVKQTGRRPEGIDLLKLKLQAQEEARQAEKLVQFKARPDSPFGKPGGWMPSDEEVKGIMSRLQSDVKKTETEAEMAARMNKQNKEAIERLKKKKEKKTAEEMFEDGDYDPSGMKDGGRIGYAFGRGLRLGSLLKKEGTTLKKAYQESIDDFIQYSGDPKYDADAILDDMLEKYGIDRDALDQYDVLDAYGKIYDNLQMNRMQSMYERAADEALTEAGLPAPRKKEAKGGLSYIIGE